MEEFDYKRTKIICSGCQGEIPVDKKECPHCAWLVKFMEKHHPTAKDLFEYLYNMAFNDGYSEESGSKFIKEIERLEKKFDSSSPIKTVWNNWGNVWYKIGYAMRMVIEFKGTGMIKHFYPNGVIEFKLEYRNGIFTI